MTEAERKRLDHVVLPRRLPGLALERYFPSPADNVLDAELASFAAPGDTILDPWSGPAGPRAAPFRTGCGWSRPRPAPSPRWRPRRSCFPRGRGGGRRVRPARVVAPGGHSAPPAHRGAVRLALPELQPAGGGRGVHLAARRRRAGPQGLSLHGLRHLPRRCRRAGRGRGRGRLRQARARAACPGRGARDRARGRCRRGPAAGTDGPHR